jgi:hypothetical protein
MRWSDRAKPIKPDASDSAFLSVSAALLLWARPFDLDVLCTANRDVVSIALK